MVVEPVPSALRKSPPWHMKLGICPAVSQGSADFASRSIHAGVFIETRRGETHPLPEGDNVDDDPPHCQDRPHGNRGWITGGTTMHGRRVLSLITDT